MKLFFRTRNRLNSAIQRKKFKDNLEFNRNKIVELKKCLEGILSDLETVKTSLSVYEPIEPDNPTEQSAADQSAVDQSAADQSAVSVESCDNSSVTSETGTTTNTDGETK